jgi:hypothetical protein
MTLGAPCPVHIASHEFDNRMGRGMRSQTPTYGVHSAASAQSSITMSGGDMHWLLNSRTVGELKIKRKETLSMAGHTVLVLFMNRADMEAWRGNERHWTGSNKLAPV